MITGDVNIQIIDNGAASIIVPGASTQLVMGVSKVPSGGASPFQIVATQNPNTLLSYFGPGPLTEAAALSALAGGTILAINLPVTTKGTATGPVLTQGSGASTGSTVITTTLDGTQGAYDDYYVLINVTLGGPIGTGPIQLQVSLDAGRNFGPTINLGTSSSLLIPNTGITLNFSAGSLVTGNQIRFSSVAPIWQISDVQNGLNAYKSSPYSLAGVGTMHLVGVCTGANIQALNNNSTGFLDVFATNYLFDRMICTVRDAAGPMAFTGSSTESEATWMSSIGTAASSVSTGVDSARLCVNAGYYNQPSAYPNQMAGTPSYRRPLAWATAAREVIIPPQRHAGRVKDGALSTIVVNPVTDPTDGFIYHDERLNPGLDGFKFSSARTRIGKGAGFYIVNPNLMSTPGSSFTILPLGLVMDVACDIVHQVGQDEINDDLRTNQNGTIFENDARALEEALGAALNSDMLGVNMITGYTVVVDRTTNIQVTGTINIAVTIQSRAYVLTENVTLSYLQPGQAQ